MEFVLHGRQGKTLTVSGDTARIVKESVFAAKREKGILLRNVTSVEVKQPGPLVAGFIQFSIAGGKARDSSYSFSGGAFDAAQDENSVVFVGQDQYETALKIKAYIENWSANQHQPAPKTSVVPVSVADEIRKLKALESEGLLTTQEFEDEKKKLLAR
jgi:hypothetical protein